MYSGLLHNSDLERYIAALEKENKCLLAKLQLLQAEQYHQDTNGGTPNESTISAIIPEELPPSILQQPLVVEEGQERSP